MAILVAGPLSLSHCKPYYNNHAHNAYSRHQTISQSKWVASQFLLLKDLNKQLYTCGLDLLTTWDARAHLGQSFLLNGLHKGFRRKGRRRFAQASLFGVGAPEALVIGVVALLVFGPKGLAEVARTLGRSLRAFQPTIRELQEVSRDFKNTLEQEIGLEELRSIAVEPSKSTSKMVEQENLEQNGPPIIKEFSSEDSLQAIEDQIETLVPEEKLIQSDGPPVTEASSSEDSLQVTEDEIKTVVPEEQPKESKAYSSEDYLKVTEDHIKTVVPTDKLKESTEECAELGSSSASILSQESSEDGKPNNGKVV